MYRFKFTIPDSTMRVRYGALQAEALTSGWIDRTVYLVSENSLYFAEVVVGVFHQRQMPAFRESLLSQPERESAISSIQVRKVASFEHAVQSVCSGWNEDTKKCISVFPT